MHNILKRKNTAADIFTGHFIFRHQQSLVEKGEAGVERETLKSVLFITFYRKISLPKLVPPPGRGPNKGIPGLSYSSILNLPPLAQQF